MEISKETFEKQRREGRRFMRNISRSYQDWRAGNISGRRSRERYSRRLFLKPQDYEEDPRRFVLELKFPGYVKNEWVSQYELRLYEQRSGEVICSEAWPEETALCEIFKYANDPEGTIASTLILSLF